MKRLLCAAAALALSAAGHAVAEPRPGDAPAFAGPQLNGAPLDLRQFRGRVTIVDIWATWCGPCRVELPMLDRFRQSHRGVAVVGLSADRPRDAGDARRIASRLGFPNAMLARAEVNGFGLPRVLPQTYVLDRSGRISAVLDPSRGPLSPQVLERAVASAE